jgi:type II secretory pathway predicted ATPase ExeA
MNLSYLPPYAEVVHHTKQMEDAGHRIQAVHPALVMLTGLPGTGKTLTALEFTNYANRHWPVCAHYHEVKTLPLEHPQEDARTLQWLAQILKIPLSPIPVNRSKSSWVEQSIMQIVSHLQLKSLQYLFLDEAGRLTLDAIRTLTSVFNYAQQIGHPLSIIFIGMGDLLRKAQADEQVKRRIHEWIHFYPAKQEDLVPLLSKLHPYFRDFDASDPAYLKMIAFFLQGCGGILGQIVPVLKRLNSLLPQKPSDFSVEHLQAAYLQFAQDRTAALDESTGKNKKG